MRSTSVRRGNGGSRASRYRWGELGTQCSSRCLKPHETLAGLFTVACFSGSAIDAPMLFRSLTIRALRAGRAFIEIAFPPLTS
jgi:hypothetical protein